MKLSRIVQTNSPVFNQIKNQFKLTLAEAPNYLNSMRQINKDLVYKKFTELNNWYTRVLGLDEVKFYQNRVVDLQEKLLSTQEKRREIGRQLAEIRKNSNELQDKIHKVKRQENLEVFLNLMKEETEVLKMENEIQRVFQDYDLMERELFTAFTNAIRDSHEKQRAQLEYTKYFGIILSIAGSFLAFCYTTLRKEDLKRFIDHKLSTPNIDDVKQIINNNNNAIVGMINSNQNELKKLILGREYIPENQFEHEVFINRNYIYLFSAAVVLIICSKCF